MTVCFKKHGIWLTCLFIYLFISQSWTLGANLMSFRPHLLLVNSYGRRRESTFLASLPLWEIISFVYHHHFSKALSPSAVTLGLGPQHVNFWKTKTFSSSHLQVQKRAKAVQQPQTRWCHSCPPS